MSTLTKVFVVLNSVLSIVVSILFVTTAAQWSNYKEVADIRGLSATRSP